MEPTIDYWKQQAHACQDALLQDLAPLIAIESVREDDKATASQPFGPGPAAALDYMLTLAKRDGFEVENVDNYAGVIRYGEGEKILGLLAHLDVVPATGDWDTPPFEATVKGDRLCGRGTTDDKGPAMACYYALKLLKEAGITPHYQVHLILGTDEESNWECMDHYFSKKPKPDIAFSPDADFPIINGEKGLMDLPFFSTAEKGGADGTLLSFHAGIRDNVVPEEGIAVIESAQAAVIAEGWEKFIAAHEDIQGTTSIDGQQVTLTCKGHAAHGMEPEVGVNAGTYLASYLSDYDLGEVNAFMHFVGRVLHLHFFGESLGIASHDEVMGDVSVNPGIITFEKNEGTALLNVRYPRSTSQETILQQVDAMHFDVRRGTPQHTKPVHYVPGDDPLVRTLLDVYREHTGRAADECSIGGITYAHILEHGVAYGMTMPDSDVIIHQPNESLMLADLEAGTAIFADAIYRLTK